MKKKKIITSEEKIVIYQAKSGALELRADTARETFWLTQQQVADIFNVQKAAISRHVKNVFESGELEKSPTVSKMETVQTEGMRTVKRTIEYYNLDLVLSIGYRVNSKQATHFRRWATKTLRQYIVDGNKRSGAYAFVWFLRQANILDVSRLTPVALTALTLLVAESNPKDKEKVIGLTLALLSKN